MHKHEKDINDVATAIFRLPCQGVYIPTAYSHQLLHSARRFRCSCIRFASQTRLAHAVFRVNKIYPPSPPRGRLRLNAHIYDLRVIRSTRALCSRNALRSREHGNRLNTACQPFMISDCTLRRSCVCISHFLKTTNCISRARAQPRQRASCT